MSEEPTKLRFFDSHEAARVYADARPYFHPMVMERVRTLANLPSLENGLDVGCGTGLSTRALKLLARNVVGTDISEAMIQAAEEMEGVSYRVAAAELLPVLDETQDIVTISSAFHWVDPVAFLNDVKRVLKPNGLLVIYENGFTGEMKDQPEFMTWLHTRHLDRFPTPPRKPKFSLDNAPDGLSEIANENYQNEVVFTKDQLIEYFLTQSNAIAKVEDGETTFEEARAWLKQELKFDKPATFVFAGTIHVLSKR